MEFIIQLIGFAALGCFLSSYQMKSNKALIVVQSIGNALFGMQYLVLGGLSGTINVVIVLLRNFMVVKFQDKPWIRWKGWILVFCTLTMISTIVTWKDMTSILPCLAVLAGNIGYWSYNAQTIRLCNLLVCCPSWMLFDIFTGSWGGLINEILTIGSILFSIYRYGWKAMGENNFEGK